MNPCVDSGAHRFALVEVGASICGSDPFKRVSEVILSSIGHQGLKIRLESVIDRNVKVGIGLTRVERSPGR